MADVYQIITDRIISQLEAGTVPWRKPWKGSPTNLVSKKEYRGLNVMILATAGFGSPYWLSFKQVGQLGGTVRKGSKSTPVIFWKRNNYTSVSTDDETGEVNTETKTGLLLRYYNVFNVEQCDSLDLSKIPEIQSREFNPIEEAEAIIEAMPNRPPIKHKEPQAYYSPVWDFVNMPTKKAFKSDEEYYSTLFHELTHSTGHATRLDRRALMKNHNFGSKDYSQEELVAEMGSAFLSAHCGIVERTIDNSASYIDSWLRRFKSDKRMLIYAGAQAQKASDFILGKRYESI